MVQSTVSISANQTLKPNNTSIIIIVRAAVFG